MAGNTFGRILRLTTFGESHGPAIGGILDGCPAGIDIDTDEIQRELDLRKPGKSPLSTNRKESDRIQLLSGIFEGKSSGTPIGFIVINEDQRSKDYGNLKSIFRPGHADWSYFCKYHGIRDYRGGGRSSGRETAIRVAAGAIAKKILRHACDAQIYAGCVELGGIEVPENEIDLASSYDRPYFAASCGITATWDKLVEENRSKHDTLGGIVRIVAKNVPAGLGEPVFDKLDAMLAYALMGIGAVKGVEVGSGFRSARSSGSQNNDPIFSGKQYAHPASESIKWIPPNVQFGSNNAGGILGGISSGQDIVLQVAVKPIASIPQPQSTVDIEGNNTTVVVGGRHDLSAIPRIIPVLTAMTALTIADALLLQKRMDGCR